jgi:hypothetical protein
MAQAMQIRMVPTFFVINRKGGIYQLTGLEKMIDALKDPLDGAWR